MFAVAFVAGGFILCQEAVRFDKDLQPRFSAHQIERCSAAIRDGLARWAATPHGRALVKRFNSVDYRIMIVEDTSEEAAGKAPEPGIATMASVGESSPVKTYLLILNPSFVLPKGMIPLPGQPATPADMMAAAWAGEMLHIDFYSRGISLPHHARDDFQEEWRAIAAELGFPALRHDDNDDRNEAGYGRRSFVRIISIY